MCVCVCASNYTRANVWQLMFFGGTGKGDSEQDKFLPQDGKIFYQ